MKLSRRSMGFVAIMAMLPGCMKDLGADAMSRFQSVEFGSTGADGSSEKSFDLPSDSSAIIQDLQHRPSQIIENTPYAQVANAVIASDARVAEAELRVARLREEASKYNWLPQIGPVVSLNSLGDVVADLLINQVIFDNGRKEAERDLALANVEIAAVSLVEDGNARVHDALSLYLTAEENREIRRQLTIAIKDMSQFEWIMQERVKGGVSDRSDLNVLQQKLSTMRARSAEADEAIVTAMAELHAMSAIALDDVHGLGGLREDMPAEALGVLRAQGEEARANADAKIARASHLPGLFANASGGTSPASIGLDITTDQLFGLGTPADLEALEISKETARRQVEEAREEADRDIAAQSRKLTAFRRQAVEATGLTRRAKQNLDLFQVQYDSGQRQVMDVVGVYETFASAVEREIDLKFKAARAELELARLKGGLAEGAQI